MKRLLIFCVVFFYSNVITYAQYPGIAWQNTIGGTSDDYFYSIQQTSDGGYILGGFSWSGISGDKTEASQGSRDYWVLKLDATGNIIWQNTIGGNGPDRLYVVQQTSDGGYILGGDSESGISGDKTEANIGGRDYWIIKLDATGNIIWQNTIGGSEPDYLKSIQQTSDGGYILGGFSQSGISGDKTENTVIYEDYWVVKLDTTGNIIWQNTIGGSAQDWLYVVRQTADGGYILGGHSNSNISGDKTGANLGWSDNWIVKLDDSGNIDWDTTIGGADLDLLYTMEQTSDGGYILGGFSKSGISGDKTEASHGDYDFWVVKLDAIGNIVWQNTIGGNGFDEMRSILETTNGNYIIGGTSNSSISGDKTEDSNGVEDFWIVKLDKTGQSLLDQKTIGGIDSDHVRSIQETIDGGIIIGGTSLSGISGDKTENSIGQEDYWIVKLKPNALNIEQIESQKITGELTTLPAYPNPFNPNTNITYGLDSENYITVEIYNVSGQLITTLVNSRQNSGWHTTIWDGTNQKGIRSPAGLYISKISSNNAIKVLKLMLLK